MSSWRLRILGEFTPGVAPVTLVADPDGLLLEEGVLTDIHERGFEILPFEDPSRSDTHTSTEFARVETVASGSMRW